MPGVRCGVDNRMTIYETFPDDGDEGLTARCPFGKCEHQFVEATDSQIAEHFNGHFPGKPLPASVAVASICRMIEYQREKNDVS